MKQVIKITAVFLITFFFLLSFSSRVMAARNLNIIIDKTVLYGEDELTVTATSSGFSSGETIYIKGAFHQEGSTNYFGYTKSNDPWIKNGDSTVNQRSIVVGDWDGKLVVKSDFLDTGYKGEGDYLFKVGFYYITSGGNFSSVNWSSNSASLIINEPEKTPTQTSTPTSTSTPNPTPTPTKTPTAIPVTVSMASSPAEILGESTDSAATFVDFTTPIVEKVEIERETKVLGENNSAKLLISLGVIFMLVCGILAFRAYRKRRNEIKNL